MITTDPSQPPGEAIKAELQRRGWTQADFATIMNRDIATINEILNGKRQITAEIAVQLGIVLGTPAEDWLQREASYRLSLIDRADPNVQRRARLYELGPIKEMEKRGWIKQSNNLNDIEREVRSFFNLNSLDDEPKINVCARQPFESNELTASQRAWVFRAAQLASVLNVRPFTTTGFDKGLSHIRDLADSAEKAHHVPRLLAELGVRLVVIEPLQKSPIDGAAFWLDGPSPSPVIVLSLRFDRIDAFWFTLAHELMHIRFGDRRSLDSDLVGETRHPSNDEIEARADRGAASFLVPAERLQSFVLRVRPYYSKVKITQFAQRMRVHPGIVNGQLQHLNEVGWNANREMLENVRGLVTATAITDGWGKTVAVK
jgi:HTH-type transcriptional regulator/antitoxin HigA